MSLNAISTLQIALIAALVCRSVRCRSIFALDDLPEKWADYTQTNTQYFGM